LRKAHLVELEAAATKFRLLHQVKGYHAPNGSTL
jgi:hypothetical protein